MALIKSIVKYAEQSARVDARVSKLETRLEAMTMNPHPLGLGLTTQVGNYAHNAMGTPPGF